MAGGGDAARTVTTTMLPSDQVIILDGGLATELEARGHDLSGKLWSARVLRDEPEAIEEAHLAFFRAGAQVAITASYQASFAGFADVGVAPEEASALLRRSVELARRAQARRRTESPDGPPLYVAASIGPFGATRADGSEYRGDYGVSRDELADFHGPRLAALVAAGPDLLAIETLPSLEEASVVVERLAAHPGVRAWVSFTCRNDREIADGTEVETAIAAACASEQVIAVGFNCIDPGLVEPLLVRAAAVTSLPFVVYPNDGRTWDAGARQWDGSAQGFDAATVRRWRDLGAGLIGGCCGVRPETIRQISEGLSG